MICKQLHILCKLLVHKSSCWLCNLCLDSYYWCGTENSDGTFVSKYENPETLWSKIQRLSSPTWCVHTYLYSKRRALHPNRVLLIAICFPDLYHLLSPTPFQWASLGHARTNRFNKIHHFPLKHWVPPKHPLSLVPGTWLPESPLSPSTSSLANLTAGLFLPSLSIVPSQHTNSLARGVIISHLYLHPIFPQPCLLLHLQMVFHLTVEMIVFFYKYKSNHSPA